VPSIRRLIPHFILIGLLLVLGSTTLSATAAQGPGAQGIPDAFTLVGENDNFQLYADPATLAFKVVDKRSGYVWHSNLDEVSEEDELNRTWAAFATSGISIDYLDQEADDERASITSAEHVIDFNQIDQGFEATLTFVEPSITLAVTVQLEPDGVRVDVPFDSVREEDPEFRLGLLHLYPFFGATRADGVSGYMFIPDGAGTLIGLAAETKARNMFLGRYYGPDLGMISNLPFDPTTNRPYQLSIPVLGMVHGEKENAFIAVVEKGASYGELRAHPAGVTTQFNFLYNAFIYNQSYFQATNRSGAGVTTLQPSTNAFDVVVHYRLLTGATGDYVGMARSYQDYLVENGRLRQQLDTSEDIGVRLEFLGAEREKVLFWHRSIPVTTLAQMSDILGQLDVNNPEVIYYGWQRGGANSMYPPALAVDQSLGTQGQLVSFAEEIAAANGRLHLYVDPQAALRDVGGYSRRHDLALSITNDNLRGANRHKFNYYLNTDALGERYRSLTRAISNTLEAGLALDGIGFTLYSDFRNDRVLNREAAIQRYQEILAETGNDTAFYLPNDYMFPHMRAYYDMPLTDSDYLYTTEAVPFLQIALGGYVPMYGRALNFSPNLRADLLRHADFGVYPSYFLTHAPTSTLLRTSSAWIFSSSYEQWGPEVRENYQWLNALLAPVKGQQVVAREMLSRGVYATTYSNGMQIVVNYNSAPYTQGGLVVDPEDAIIREVES
jgi:hypothetical protein